MWDYVVDSHLQFSWYPERVASNARTDLQIRRGDMVDGAPPWVSVHMPRHSVARRLNVRQGEVACARVRTVLADGSRSAWAGPWCVVRPLDDSSVYSEGSSRPAPDLTSPDGTSRRLMGRARLVLPGLRAGGRFGVLAYVSDWRDLGFRLDVRRWDPHPRLAVFGGRVYPDVYWVPVQHTGRGVVRSSRAPAPSSRVAGVFYIPRWAMGGLSSG